MRHLAQIDFGHRPDHHVRGHVGRQRFTDCGCVALFAGVAVVAEPQVPRDRCGAGQLTFDPNGPTDVGLCHFGLVEPELVDQFFVPGDASVGATSQADHRRASRKAEALFPQPSRRLSRPTMKAMSA